MLMNCFFIHRFKNEHGWRITHYKTGLRALTVSRLTDAEKEFIAAMRAMRPDALKEAVSTNLKKYGVVNELPEETQKDGKR